MYYMHLFFVIGMVMICAFNLGLVLYYARKFPLVIVVNGSAVMISGFAAYFNYVQL